MIIDFYVYILFQFQWQFDESSYKEDISLSCEFLFLLQGTKFVSLYIRSIEIVMATLQISSKTCTNAHQKLYPYLVMC